MKVLIVDDSKLARMAIVKVLKSLHPECSVVECADADQALTFFRQETPDFVLLDFNMPGKDGIALAAELRAMNSRIPVAVISANYQKEVVDRAVAAGATFLRKPITEQALGGFFRSLRDPGRGNH